MNSFVYIYGGQGLYKIGHAKNPAKRVKQWPQMPWPCQIVMDIKTDDAPALERYLHRHFSGCRARGEWFRIPDRDLGLIRQVAEMRGGVVNDLMRPSATPPASCINCLHAPVCHLKRDLDQTLAQASMITQSAYQGVFLVIGRGCEFFQLPQMR